MNNRQWYLVKSVPIDHVNISDKKILSKLNRINDSLAVEKMQHVFDYCVNYMSVEDAKAVLSLVFKEYQWWSVRYLNYVIAKDNLKSMTDEDVSRALLVMSVD